MMRPTALQLAFSAATLIVAAGLAVDAAMGGQPGWPDLVVLAICLMLLARSFARRRA